MRTPPQRKPSAATYTLGIPVRRWRPPALTPRSWNFTQLTAQSLKLSCVPFMCIPALCSCWSTPCDPMRQTRDHSIFVHHAWHNAPSIHCGMIGILCIFI